MSTTSAPPAGKVRRLAHFGTFDVENYGDLLLPLVLEHRLASQDCEWIHVSPIGGAPVWGDCVSTISTREARSEEVAGIVVGGGHIIHGQPSDVPPYASAGDIGLFAYADLWLGATLQASDLGIPIVWNAPGVPGSFAPEPGVLVEWAASEAAYLAVRDPQSRKFLKQAGFAGEIAIGCDTALDVDRLWSRSELDAASREAFASRRIVRSERSIAVHFTSRYFQGGIEAAARLLDDLCRTRNATAILMALGPCHGDALLQRLIGDAMETTPLVIEQPTSLREIASCIRDSDLYLGSSLHGAITATAFGRPAVIVAREVQGGHAKFTGFLKGQRSATDSNTHAVPHYVESWKEGFAVATTLEEPATLRDAFDRAAARNARALDQHWRRLTEALFRNPRTEPHKERTAGRERLDTLSEQFIPHSTAYLGILLDQARSAGQFRKSSQRNARRYRELDRLYRDLEKH